MIIKTLTMNLGLARCHDLAWHLREAHWPELWRQHYNSHSQGNHSNHGEDGDNNPHNHTTDHNPNNDQRNINHVSDSDAPSSLIAGIGLRPIDKPVTVVVDNTRRKRPARSPAPIEGDEQPESETPTLSSPIARASAARKPLCPRQSHRQGDRPCRLGAQASPGKALHEVRRREQNVYSPPGKPGATCFVPGTAAHQTLEFRFGIDAEVHKVNEVKARTTVPVMVGCSQGGTIPFTCAIEIRLLRSFAFVPASEMLVRLDEFDNTLAAGADDNLDFLDVTEDDDDDNDDDEEEEVGNDDNDNEQGHGIGLG
ncbi:uncharacterized protein BDW70DRAFT_165183 [Aspergillus foveolatus]|uniref:uncharacterized protein n=1 Tax=Aspergillus foveolatus TaxID=210207 RepID=UPI003CCCC1FD